MHLSFAESTKFLVVLALAGGCGSPMASMDGGADANVDAAPAPPTELTIGTTERPARLALPRDHDGTTEFPLIILLHGYGASAVLQNAYFQLTNRARTRGIYVVLPDGTLDADDRRFWNATDACCDLGGAGIDDVAYLTSLLDQAEAMVPVDPSRVYFMGHSNGGFMSYRMACALGSRVAAIASLAGSDFEADDACVPDSAPSVLQIHGTADDTIAYAGGMILGANYPGAESVVERWAGRAGCDVTMPSTGEPRDFLTAVPGAETAVTDYTVGCTEGRTASLWTVDGGEHIPGFAQPAFTTAVLDWLLAHHR